MSAWKEEEHGKKWNPPINKKGNQRNRKQLANHIRQKEMLHAKRTLDSGDWRGVPSNGTWIRKFPIYGHAKKSAAENSIICTIIEVF